MQRRRWAIRTGFQVEDYRSENYGEPQLPLQCNCLRSPVAEFPALAEVLQQREELQLPTLANGERHG
jgi:hypothetical protein